MVLWSPEDPLSFTLKSLHLISSASVSEGPGEGEVQHDIREEDQDESEEIKERQTGESLSVPWWSGNDPVLKPGFFFQRDKNRAELLEFLNSTLWGRPGPLEFCSSRTPSAQRQGTGGRGLWGKGRVDLWGAQNQCEPRNHPRLATLVSGLYSEPKSSSVLLISLHQTRSRVSTVTVYSAVILISWQEEGGSLCATPTAPPGGSLRHYKLQRGRDLFVSF